MTLVGGSGVGWGVGGRGQTGGLGGPSSEDGFGECVCMGHDGSIGRLSEGGFS